MKFVLFTVMMMVAAAQSFARTPDFDGFVDLSNGQKIYCIQYLAHNGAPTIVFLHGLTYTTKPWMNTVADLAQKDYGILVYDARGMGKTLEATGPIKDIITLDQQVEDLNLLLANRNLGRVDLAGLSYGGALGLAFAAKYPNHVDHVMAMAPFVKALKQQDDQINQQVKWHKMMHPTDKRSDDDIYDEYLKKNVYQTYPIAEPVIKEHPWRIEAVYQMVRGVRHFKATDIVSQLKAAKVDLIMAGKDQYVPAADHMEFWNAMSTESKISRMVIAGSEHKMPEAVPHYLAGWLSLILDRDARISGGREFNGNPKAGNAVAKDVTISGLPLN